MNEEVPLMSDETTFKQPKTLCEGLFDIPWLTGHFTTYTPLHLLSTTVISIGINTLIIGIFLTLSLIPNFSFLILLYISLSIIGLIVIINIILCFFTKSILIIFIWIIYQVVLLFYVPYKT